MSKIKKMNKELEAILGREPTIHEQVDMLILATIRDRAYELQMAYSVSPSETYKEQYEHAVRCLKEIQSRNPEIFAPNDSEGEGDEEM
jgi:hypothetical protein